LEIRNLSSAAELPDAWDEMALEYFQQREFLLHVEKHNPCRQRYYLFYTDEAFRAGLVVYTLTLNLFTYSFIRLPFRMNITGIPCSVSASGFIGNEKFLPQVIDLVCKQEKGFFVVLNLDAEPHIADIMIGRTLPTVILNHNFTDLAAYQTALRSDYRRRLYHLSQAFKQVKIVNSDCSFFTEDMHRLYLEVLKHSKGKLEKLSCDFFCHLPTRFILTAFYDNDKLLGWHITISHNKFHYFFLGGIDYNSNDKYHTYLNLLHNILKAGIEQKCPVINFGQTAEIPKQRLGGKLQSKWMLGWHSNRLIRKFLIMAKGMLEYSVKFPETHVFRDEA
jgi:hypothetical protein